MGTSTIATVIILAMLLAIISSLGFGLFYLLQNEDSSKKTVHALTLRVGFSATLFLSLLLAIQQGWVIPTPVAI